MKKLKIVGGIFFFFVIILKLTTSWIDRTPYADTEFYGQMIQRMDSLSASKLNIEKDELEIGWSVVSITPNGNMDLAGYGQRDPKLMTGVHDSIFVKTIVFRSGGKKIAFVSTDLLINHPTVTNAILEVMPEDWLKHEIFLSSTHTHSSIGHWAPGIVGNLFAGGFDDEMPRLIASKVVESIEDADLNRSRGSIGFAESSMPHLVLNRLVGKQGIIDPWMKMVMVNRDSLKGVIASFSAHATSLDHNFTELSGDYPSAMAQNLAEDFAFASFSAGAVGSMSPVEFNNGQWERSSFLGKELAEQVRMLALLGVPMIPQASIVAYRIPLELRDYQVKISTNVILREWLAKWFLGDQNPFISVFQINDIIMIGMPCDFSGELAVPLYEYAKSRGLNLVITSFNGGYIGYVPKDEWYDLGKYETKTMSWFGFDTGAYLTEIIKMILDRHATI